MCNKKKRGYAMSSKKRASRQPSALSQVLIIYRDNHKITQEDLAALLYVEPRTLRRWENGETMLTDTHELKKIADRLGVAYETLGIASSLYIPLTLEEITTSITRIWDLIDEGKISAAHAIADNLARETYRQLKTDDPLYLRSYAQMYFAIGHATSLSVQTEDTGQAIYYYQQMEYFARCINDPTLINVALTYQGDMYRRKNDMQNAILTLEQARDTTQGAETAAQGNLMQLLARSYIKAKRIPDFDTAIKTAEELAYASAEDNRSTKNQFHLAHVFEEYAKGYDILGKPEIALEYVNKAERAHTLTPSVKILLKLARAEVLIHGGDITAGEPLAIEAAIFTKEHGHKRRLERIYALKRYLNRQAFKFGKAEASLSEALEGTIET
jgi:transcriptional regulator with XRE-family HTH domain